MTSIKSYGETLLVPLTSTGKQHRLIRLPNGLLTLLISDPAEDLASAAICVASGAHNDPDAIPGLAHFCEHLLLLGSKNHPDSAEFHDRLSKYGGRRNAFTTGEQTCYFFEVPSDSTILTSQSKIEIPIFNHLIDIFADCFKNPIFSESKFEKEIYAIDNEHTANMSTKGRLLYHGLRLLSNPSHPFSRFATGNFFTLNDLPNINKLKVKDQLVKYFKENYYAENMTLVIRSPQSINSLQKIAISHFGNITTLQEVQVRKFKLSISSSKNDLKKAITLQPIARLDDSHLLSVNRYNTRIFTDSQYNNFIFISSTGNTIMRLIFPIPSAVTRSTTLFKAAWCNILGDEGIGSLDHALKQRGLSVGISAFSQTLTHEDETLVLEINLTNSGLNKVNEIISTVMGIYKEKVFYSSKEVGRFLFEMESIDLLNYLYKDMSKSPMEEASQYSQVLQTNLSVIGTENILKGTPNWDSRNNLGSSEGDKEWKLYGSQFRQFIEDTFTVENLKLEIIGETFPSDIIIKDLKDSVDSMFKFDYKIGKLILSSSIVEFDYHFTTVPKNKFIPKYALDHSNLHQILKESSLKSLESSLSFTTKSNWHTTEAKVITKTRDVEIWSKTETSKYFQSKVFLSFDITSTAIEASPLITMCAEVVVELIKLKLSEKLYASELLNYTWEMYASLKGDARFGFTISGFVGGIEILLELIVGAFEEIVHKKSFSMEDLRKSRVSVRSRYQDVTLNNSLSLAISGLLVVLEDKIWTMEDRLDALDELDSDDLSHFLDSFKNTHKSLKIVSQGDIKNFDKYYQFITRLSKHITVRDTPTEAYREPSTHQLPLGSSHYVERKGPEKDFMNSISLYIQTGTRDDIYADQLTRLVAFLLSSTLIPDLRFKKQLGYAVLSGVRVLRSTIGLHISIMSATFTCQYLKKKVEEYLVIWVKSYINMSDTEFQKKVIDLYVKSTKEKSTNSGGPESLTSAILPSVGGSNITSTGESMRSHRELRDHIMKNTYNPGFRDVDIVGTLKKSQFEDFLRQKISVESTVKSQLCIMIKSQLSAEETQLQLITLQLEAFLKLHGLRISSEKIKSIVEDSKENPVYLLKGLFKYFMGQGESIKLCTIVLKEVVKQVFESVKQYKSNASGIEAITNNSFESTRVEDIAKFQNECPVYYLKSSNTI